MRRTSVEYIFNEDENNFSPKDKVLGYSELSCSLKNMIKEKNSKKNLLFGVLLNMIKRFQRFRND